MSFYSLSRLAWLSGPSRSSRGVRPRVGRVTAVAVAGGVATLSAALAVTFRRVGGRGTTVALAYPFAMTAIFLPPVVAALYSTTVASVVIPASDSLSRWFLYEVLATVGVAEFFIENFDREGIAYVFIWLGIIDPAGERELSHGLVTLADFARPTE